MAANMGLVAKKCFPNATRVTDRFTHIFHFNFGIRDTATLNSCSKISIGCFTRNQNQIPLAIDQENEAIEKAKKGTKKFEPKVLSNGDTLKQPLARSRYLIYKNKSKWSENQIERATLLFELYPDIEKAYNLAQELRNIFEKTTDKIIGLSRLAK
jgi:transposase